jgi:hypothetical protein
MLLILPFLIALATAQVKEISVPAKMNGIAYAPLRGSNAWCVTRDNIFEVLLLD